VELTLLLVDPYGRNTTKGFLPTISGYPSAKGIYPKKILKPIVLETVVSELAATDPMKKIHIFYVWGLSDQN